MILCFSFNERISGKFAWFEFGKKSIFNIKKDKILIFISINLEKKIN